MSEHDDLEAMQALAEHLVEQHGVRVAFQLLMTAATYVLMPVGDEKAATVLRNIADRIEAGEGVTVN